MKENALAALAFLRALITATWSSAQRAGALVGVVGGVEGLQHSHDEVGNRCQPYRYPQDGDVAILWVDGWDVEGMEGCRVDNAALPLPLPLPLPCLPAFPTSAVVQQTCKRPATQVPQLKTVVNASNQSSPRGRNRWHLILVSFLSSCSHEDGFRWWVVSPRACWRDWRWPDVVTRRGKKGGWAGK
jgi:hypothetical protein